MHRSFSVTLPADATYRNLYTVLTGITGAVPTDGILPNKVAFLQIAAAQANAAALITLADRNSANTTGRPLAGSDVFVIGPFNRNVIYLGDYLVSGNGLTFQVDFESL